MTPVYLIESEGDGYKVTSMDNGSHRVFATAQEAAAVLQEEMDDA